MLSSFSSCVARRLSTSSRMPPSSPARTMLTYRRLKTLGCFSRASDSAMPASTSARTSPMTPASFLLGVCSSSTYRQRSIDRPELTIVANWREKTVRSFGLTRPPIWMLPETLLDLVEVEHGEALVAQRLRGGALAVALDLAGGLRPPGVEPLVGERAHLPLLRPFDRPVLPVRCVLSVLTPVLIGSGGKSSRPAADVTLAAPASPGAPLPASSPTSVRLLPPGAGGDRRRLAHQPLRARPACSSGAPPGRW